MTQRNISLNHNPPHTGNNEKQQKIGRLKADSSISHSGLKYISGNPHPRSWFVKTHKLLSSRLHKLLKQGFWYHKLRQTFSKFYRRYYGLISKFQVGLKSLLRQGLSEPDFYGDLVYKLKRIVGSNNFSAQFIKIISHYKKIGYNINVLQQTACLVVNPIMVGNFAFLFNCTPVGRTSDSMMDPT